MRLGLRRSFIRSDSVMASQDFDACLDPPGACAVTKIFGRESRAKALATARVILCITGDRVVSRARQWRQCLFPRLPHARLGSPIASLFNQDADLICVCTVVRVFLRISDNLGIEQAESERLARIVNKCELLFCN